MSADMDPNDHDTVHYLISVPWVGSWLRCDLPGNNKLTSTDWGEVTCRLCKLYQKLGRV